MADATCVERSCSNAATRSLTARPCGSPSVRVHELALMESLVAAVRENVARRRVKRVKLRLGKLTCVSADALRCSFDVVARGTVLERAELEIVEVAGRGRCRSCGAGLPLELPVFACRCGSFDVEVIEGEELRLQEVEVV